jgi:arginine exporter protein ArgO
VTGAPDVDVAAALGAGLAAGYAIAVPVGAIALYLITLSSRAGFTVGAAAGLGVATVDGTYAAVAVLAGSVVGPWLAAVHEPLRWVSVVVLVALGVRIAWPALRPRRVAVTPGVVRHRRWGNPGDAVEDDAAVTAAEDAAGRRPSPARAYATLVGLTAVNPATVVYFAALVTAGGLGAAAPLAERVTFVVGAFAASASWQLVVATGGSLLGRGLAGPTAQRVTAAVGGGVVVLLALQLGLRG